MAADAPGRILLVLDDVWFDAPARALHSLLPSDSTCLITTRDRALNLGGRVHNLDHLSATDAHRLLVDRLEHQGDLTSHHADLLRLIELLEGHALALEIAAANLVINGLSHLPQYIPDIEVQMAKPGGIFAELSREFADTARERSLEAAFALSYNPLPYGLKQRFWVLGLFPSKTDYTELDFVQKLVKN